MKLLVGLAVAESGEYFVGKAVAQTAVSNWVFATAEATSRDKFRAMAYVLEELAEKLKEAGVDATVGSAQGAAP